MKRCFRKFHLGSELLHEIKGNQMLHKQQHLGNVQLAFGHLSQGNDKSGFAQVHFKASGGKASEVDKGPIHKFWCQSSKVMNFKQQSNSGGENKQLLGEKLSSSPEIFLFFSLDRRERQTYEGGLIGKCCCAIFSSVFFLVCTREFVPFWHGPDQLQHAGSAPSCMKVLPGSWRLLLSGRDGGAGEHRRVPWWLESEGRGRRDLARAAQITVVKLPDQLFILHRQTFVHFGLLLEGFLQNRLLCGQLSENKMSQRSGKLD